MQDRFKFRVWHTPWGETEQPEMLYNAELAYDYMGEVPASCFGSVLTDESFEVMQCTGLKDKNGTLIYEGDIVKFYFDRDKIIGVITWDNEHQVGFYVNTTDYFKDKYIANYDFLCGFNYEVIGNIYENPELLESN